MEGFALIAVLAFIIIVAIWVLRVPVMIAKTRGISGSDLDIISILSWCGVFIGITWVAAFILAFLWSPAPQKQSAGQTSFAHLQNLYEQGFLSESEYQTVKARILREYRQS